MPQALTWFGMSPELLGVALACRPASRSHGRAGWWKSPSPDPRGPRSGNRPGLLDHCIGPPCNVQRESTSGSLQSLQGLHVNALHRPTVQSMQRASTPACGTPRKRADGRARVAWACGTKGEALRKVAKVRDFRAPTLCATRLAKSGTMAANETIPSIVRPVNLTLRGIRAVCVRPATQSIKSMALVPLRLSDSLRLGAATKGRSLGGTGWTNLYAAANSAPAKGSVTSYASGRPHAEQLPFTSDVVLSLTNGEPPWLRQPKAGRAGGRWAFRLG